MSSIVLATERNDDLINLVNDNWYTYVKCTISIYIGDSRNYWATISIILFVGKVHWLYLLSCQHICKHQNVECKRAYVFQAVNHEGTAIDLWTVGMQSTIVLYAVLYGHLHTQDLEEGKSSKERERERRVEKEEMCC